MNILNKENKIVIRNFPVTTGEYSIHRLDNQGCVQSTAIVTGSVSNQVEHVLPDGKYVIKVYQELSVNVEEIFVVFYNGLPRFLSNLKGILCDCSNCPGEHRKPIHQVLFEFIGYVNALGSLCSTLSLDIVLSKYHEILQEKVEYEAYYGTFKFDYDRAIVELLVNFYIELYSETSSIPSEVEEDLIDTNNLFEIVTLEKCIYNKDFNIESIVRSINNLNCGCDE